MARNITAVRIKRTLASMAVCLGLRPFYNVGYRFARTYLFRYESMMGLVVLWLLCWLYLHNRAVHNKHNIKAPNQPANIHIDHNDQYESIDNNQWSSTISSWLPNLNMFGAKTVFVGANELQRAIRASQGANRIAYSNAFHDEAQMAWYASVPNEMSFFAAQGVRPYMEDRMDYITTGSSNCTVYSLYDGHGSAFVSNALEQQFAVSLINKVAQSVWMPDWNKTYMDQVLAFDRQMLSKHTTGAASGAALQPQNFNNPTFAGSTLLCAVLYRNRFLAVGNVGDSRAIACDAAGKARNALERARIEAAGGFVAFNGVWRVGGTLAVSRAIGDGYLKKSGWLVANPDTFVIDLTMEPMKYLILATDGLWDVLNAQEAVNVVLRHEERNQLPNAPKKDGLLFLQAAQALVNLALKKGSLDNVSVMIVNLQKASKL